MISAKVTSEVRYTLGGSVKVGVNDKGPNADTSITGIFVNGEKSIRKMKNNCE